jgi:hypothetical protein
MMPLLLASFVALVLAFSAMAVGVLLGRAPLRPGCAGAMAGECGVCSGPCPKRRAREPEESER